MVMQLSSESILFLSYLCAGRLTHCASIDYTDTLPVNNNNNNIAKK